MQKNKKVLVGLAVLGIAFLVPSTTQAAAKYSWKTYFSFEQVKALQSKTNNGILNKIENDNEWKDAIYDAAKVKDNAITSEKIKDGVIVGADIKAGTITSANVDSTVVKKKIYTGTMPTDTTSAEKSYPDSDGTTYYKEVVIPEISVSSFGSITVYNKIFDIPTADWDDEYAAAFSGSWENTNFITGDGKIWIKYAYVDIATPTVTDYEIKDYKIVVNY